MPKQTGQAMVEYLVVAVALVVALLVPLTPGGESAVEMLMNAIIDQYDAYAYAASMPPIFED